MNTLKLSLVTRSMQVVLETDGAQVEYELREMKASARDAYLDGLSERIRVDKDGKAAGIKRFEGMQADLLARCLVSLPEGKPVSKETIQAWPASAVAALFDAAQKVNKLEDKAEDTAPKND